MRICNLTKITCYSVPDSAVLFQGRYFDSKKIERLFVWTLVLFYPPKYISLPNLYNTCLQTPTFLIWKYFQLNLFLKFKTKKTYLMKAWLCNMPSLQKLLKISLVPIIVAEKNLQRLYFLSSCLLPVFLLLLPLISQGACHSSASQLQLMIAMRYLMYSITNKLWGRCRFYSRFLNQLFMQYVALLGPKVVKLQRMHLNIYTDLIKLGLH